MEEPAVAAGQMEDSEIAPSSLRIGLLCTIAAVALGLALSGPKPAPADLTAPVILAAGALLSEANAVRLPGIGFATTSAVFILATAWINSLGVAWAGALTLLVNLVGAVRQGHPDSRLRTLECLSSALPILLSLAVMSFLGSDKAPSDKILSLAAGVLVYVFTTYEMASRLGAYLPPALRERYRLLQSRLIWPPPVCCTLAIGLAAFSNPWLIAVFFPIVWVVQLALKQTVMLEEQGQRRDVIKELGWSQTALEKSSAVQSQLRTELSEKIDEYRTLETASRALLHPNSCSQVAEEIVKLCQTFVASSSLVVFFHQESRLLPAFYVSRNPERVQGAELGGWREPIVEQAFATNSTQSRWDGQDQARIFPQERYALAFPLGRLGVLYAGKSDAQFTPAEFRDLSQAASQGALGLQIASQLQTLQSALQQQAQAASELRRWAEAVDLILAYAVHFLDQLERPVLLEKLGQTVQALFPQHSVEISFAGTHPSSAAQAVIASRTPLLIDDIRSSKFEPHHPGQQSLLIIPIVHPDLSQVGLIILGAGPANAFQRMQRDLLCLLALLAAVAWRNAELHQETVAAQSQLAQSSKMAAIGQLAAGVAHELNTPLGSIAVNIDLATRMLDKEPEKARQRLQKTSEVLVKAKGIVSKLLGYARETPLDRKLTDVDALCRDTLELIAHSLGLEGVKVSFLPGQPPPIELNPNEIQQVLINLMINARDALADVPEARKSIIVKTFQKDGYLGISVLDQGNGIAPEHRERVLDPFFTTKEIGRGTGLGLSVSQQIVQAHRGSLTFRSQQSVGTEFIVLLPDASSKRRS